MPSGNWNLIPVEEWFEEKEFQKGRESIKRKIKYGYIKMSPGGTLVWFYSKSVLPR